MNDNMQILSYIYIRELNNTPHTNIMIYIRERPHTHYLHTDTENQNSFANVLPYTHILTPHHTHTLCTFFKSPFSVLTIHTPFSLSLSLSSLLQCSYYLFRLLIISTYESCLAHIRLLEYGTV